MIIKVKDAKYDIIKALLDVQSSSTHADNQHGHVKLHVMIAFFYKKETH